MYGQMTAGSWIYIGTQGILQGTYETFARVAAKRFRRLAAGTITLTGGLGGMGGAQPLAVTMNGGVVICVECDQSRITRRIEYGYLDEQAENVQDAVRRAVEARDKGQPLSIGPARQRRRRVPAPVPGQGAHRHRHRPDLGARPAHLPAPGRGLRGYAALRAEDPEGFTSEPRFHGRTGRRHGRVPRRRRRGLRLRQLHPRRGPAAGYDRAFEFPGFVPAYIRPLFCEGKGPFRWAALSGDPADIAATDRAILEEFPQNESLARWIRLPRRRCTSRGCPPDLLARLRRAAPGRDALQRDGGRGRAVRAHRAGP